MKVKKSRFKVKQVEGKKSKNKQLSLVYIEKMFELFCEGHTIKDVAKEMGLPYHVVLKYFRKGEAYRGIEPLSVRRKRVMDALALQSEKRAFDAVSALRGNTVDIAGALKKRLVERIDAAHILENPELYQEENKDLLSAALAQALNPTVDDYRRLVDSYATLERSIGAAAPNSVVNVQANQVQHNEPEIVNRAEMCGVDFISEQIKIAQKSYGPGLRDYGDDITARVNYSLEKKLSAGASDAEKDSEE